MPEISIIVPVYKVEPYLHRCIDSILAQTFTDFELILVDDGSPDNCPAICDEYAAKDDRIIVIHKENGGLSSARNAGLDWIDAHSNSQWLTFIDSDDWVHPQFLQLLYETATSTNTLISMCSYEKTSDFFSFDTISNWTSSIVSPRDAYVFNSNRVAAYAWARLYSRNVYLPDFRFPIGKLWEDLFTTYKILYSVKTVSIVDYPLYYYFINRDGIVLSAWSPQKMDQLDAYSEQIPFFEALQQTDLVNRLATAYINCIHHNYQLANSSSFPNKQYYCTLLKNKMRPALRKFSKMLHITIANSSHLYECAYPRFMNCYWLWQVTLKKLHIRK